MTGVAAAAESWVVTTSAAGEAHAPRADWLRVMTGCPETARTMPRVRPSASGMPNGMAKRAARLLPLCRRRADRCPLSIQATSVNIGRSRWLTVDLHQAEIQEIQKIGVYAGQGHIKRFPGGDLLPNS